MINFRDISTDDIETINELTYRFRLVTGTYAAYNLFCLRHKYSTRISEYSGMLYFQRPSMDTNTHICYLLPHDVFGEDFDGNRISSVLDVICRDADQRGSLPLIIGITPEVKQMIEEYSPGRFDFAEHRDWSEYLYSPERLSNISKLRTGLEHLEDMYRDYVVEKITANGTIMDEVSAYQDEWMKTNIKYNDMPDSLIIEDKVIRDGFQHWDLLKLDGIAVRIDGRIRGYAVGSIVSEEAFVSHVLKFDRDIRGLNSGLIINQWGKMKTTYVNAEEDIGLEGLRRFKKSLKPKLLLTKYTAKPTGY